MAKKETPDWKIPLIVVGSILGLIIIVGAIALVSNSGITGNVVNGNSQDSTQEDSKKNCWEEQIPYEEQEEYLKTEYYTETVPYTDQECNTRYSEYYTEEWRISKPCIDTNFWGNCIERRIDCIYGLKNIDTEGGTWTIGMKVKNLDLMSEVNLGEQSQYIAQSVTKTFTWSYTTNRVDDAFTCEITSFDNPTIKECKDVIKYRDVQKTREVTAYKPVTKYRTEEVCD